jgi:outer membrane murein-binding lipoprotein Lpp
MAVVLAKLLLAGVRSSKRKNNIMQVVPFILRFMKQTF